MIVSNRWETVSMSRFLSTTAAALFGAALLAAPASANLVITGTSATPAPHGTGAGENNFRNDIESALGGTLGTGTLEFVTGGMLTLAWDVVLTFTEVGHESGFSNSFTDGTNTISETGADPSNLFGGGGDSFSGIYGPGDLADLEFTTTSGGINAKMGQGGFGIFYDTADLSKFFLGFDDSGAGPDDNHDDYVVMVEVAPVPLPAGVLLLGLGLAGVGGVRAIQARRKAA